MDSRRPNVGFCVDVRDGSIAYARILEPDPVGLGCIVPAAAAGASVQPDQGTDAPVAGAIACDAAAVVRELDRAARHRDVAPWIPLGGVFLVWILIVAAVIAGGGAFGVLMAVAAAVVVTWAAYGAVKRMDAKAGSSLIVYRIDEATRRRFSALQAATRKLANSSRVWHVPAEGRLIEPQHEFGALRFLRRYRIRPGLSTPARIFSNLAIPTMYGEARRYFFFPDRVLVYDSRGVRPLPYDRVNLRTFEVLVVEDEDVPSDARVVGETWLHPLSDGLPDPAVHGNRRCPIVLYGALELAGKAGAPDLFHGSSPGALEAFAAALHAIAAEDEADEADAESEESGPGAAEPGEAEIDCDLVSAVLRYAVGGGICSIDAVGTRFTIAFALAARLLATLEDEGFLGPARKDGSRAVRRSAVRCVALLDRNGDETGDRKTRAGRPAVHRRRRRGPPLESREILGVTSAASVAEITEAYRELARLYHPDKVASLAPELQELAEQRMKEINAAYSELMGTSQSARRARER